MRTLGLILAATSFGAPHLAWPRRPARNRPGHRTPAARSPAPRRRWRGAIALHDMPPDRARDRTRRIRCTAGRGRRSTGAATPTPPSSSAKSGRSIRSPPTRRTPTTGRRSPGIGAAAHRDLRAAGALLDEQASEYPKPATRASGDARSLETRIQGELARGGDEGAARLLAEQADAAAAAAVTRPLPPAAPVRPAAPRPVVAPPCRAGRFASQDERLPRGG